MFAVDSCCEFVLTIVLRWLERLCWFDSAWLWSNEDDIIGMSKQSQRKDNHTLGHLAEVEAVIRGDAISSSHEILTCRADKLKHAC